jgi:hypothetical protein
MKQTTRSSDTLNRLAKCEDCGEKVKNKNVKCPECNSENVDYNWNSLKNAYQKHDVAEAYFKGRIDQIGLQVEHWGIDERENDNGLIYDNKMDLRLWEPIDADGVPQKWPSGNYDGIAHHYEEDGDRWKLRGVIDVKSKTNEDWFGICNLRHYIHYAEWARRYDVPVFIYFTMVDMDAESVGEKNVLVPIKPFEGMDEYVNHYDRDSSYKMENVYDIEQDSGQIERAFRAPDGNIVVKFEESLWENFDWFVENVL